MCNNIATCYMLSTFLIHWLLSNQWTYNILLQHIKCSAYFFDNFTGSQVTGEPIILKYCEQKHVHSNSWASTMESVERWTYSEHMSVVWRGMLRECLSNRYHTEPSRQYIIVSAGTQMDDVVFVITYSMRLYMLGHMLMYESESWLFIVTYTCRCNFHWWLFDPLHGCSHKMGILGFRRFKLYFVMLCQSVIIASFRLEKTILKSG